MVKPVRNILSCKVGTIFKGKEIKEWIQYHLTNDTSKTRIAKQMIKYLNIEDMADYRLYRGTYESSASYKRYLVERVG